MALIKCTECGKEASDQAIACPSCGNPIKSKADATTNPVEIELTSKKWKKRGLWGLLFCLSGFVAMFSSVGLGIFLVFIGFILVVTSRMGAWWTNG